MGKTNLLDAIHYLSLAKSHLSTVDKLAVKKGFDEAQIAGSFCDEEGEEHRIGLKICIDKAKTMSRNGREYRRLSDHIGRFPVVIISPNDQKLIKGSAGDRRRFLDRLLSQLYPDYLQAIVKYNYALNQRNALLQKQMSDPLLYRVIEGQLAESAVLISEKRRLFVDNIRPIFSELYSYVCGYSEEVDLHYKTSITMEPYAYADFLSHTRRGDLRMGVTSYGVHKDDMDLLLYDELMRKVGSEGQNKTFLIGLKFAEYRLLSEATNVKPILLLDDLFDKLDAERVERIIELVGSNCFGQIFITDTNRKYLDDIIQAQGADYQLFELNRGTVTHLSEGR